MDYPLWFADLENYELGDKISKMAETLLNLKENEKLRARVVVRDGSNLSNCAGSASDLRRICVGSASDLRRICVGSASDLVGDPNPSSS